MLLLSSTVAIMELALMSRSILIIEDGKDTQYHVTNYKIMISVRESATYLCKYV